MASASLTIDWGILSHIGVQAAEEERDGLAINSGLMAMYEAAKGKGTPKWTSGGRFQASVQMFVHTGATSFQSGFEAFDPTAIEPNRSALYQFAITGMLLKLGANEITAYGSTTAGLRPKVESLVKNGMSFLHRAWTQRIVAGIGSGFTPWGTFNGFDNTGTTGGVFERAAAGSQTNTIGGLSKSTYAFAIGWNNRVINLNNAFGSNFNGLFQLKTAVNRHKAGGKKGWLFSDMGMNNYKRAVYAQERYMSKDDLDAGRPVEVFARYPIYQEPQMPVSTATGGATTNTYPITAYLVDTDDIYFRWLKAVKMAGTGDEIPDGYFGAGAWAKISGMQAVWGMPLWVAGQTIVTDMGSSGAAYAGESY